jgi:hypothetical protein
VGKVCGRGIWCKFCVYKYVNGKMIPVENVPGMVGGSNKGEWIRG